MHQKLKEISPTEPDINEWNETCCICEKANRILFQYFIDGKEKYICSECHFTMIETSQNQKNDD